jgi:hypothetical protein
MPGKAGVDNIELASHGYCTMGAIRALCPHSQFGTSSRPTEIQVIDEVFDFFQKMNGILEVQGYVTPVPSTAATAMNILGRINALPAAAFALASNIQAGNRPSALTERLEKLYNEEWAEFRDGKIKLIGATRRANHVPRTDERQPEYQMRVDSTGNEEAPIFDMNTDW